MTDRGGRERAVEFGVHRYETCGGAWIGLLRHVWAAGEAGMDDPGPVIEGPPIMFEIASLSWEDPVLREFGDRRLIARARDQAPAPLPAGTDGAHGAGQLRWVVELLRARPWTTSAWISLTVPGPPGETMPCVTALSFRIRGYRLVMTAMFRTLNVNLAYLTCIPLHAVGVRVAAELGLPPGPLRIFADVPHVESGDIDRVATVLAAQPEPHAA